MCLLQIKLGKFRNIIIPAVLFCLGMCLMILSSCRTRQSVPVSKTGIYFDTVITITLYDGSEADINQCFALCDKYEKLFSRTIPDSEISLINSNSQNGVYTKVSADTIALLKYGIQYSEISNGRFDITVGELTKLWDYDKMTVPKEEEIRSCVKNIDYRQLLIRENEVLLNNPHSSLDVGGIAKGYIADRLKEYLKHNAVKKGMINLGGNILLIGTKPDKTDYNIGIQRPFSADGTSLAILHISDESIVTSGVYERYFRKGEELFHHILDTGTGYPVSNGLLSVTIVSEKSVDGDGLSTSVFALGMAEGMKLVENIEGVEAILVDEDYQIMLTSGLHMKGNVIEVNCDN